MRLGAKMSEALGSRVVLSMGILLAGVATIVSSRVDNFGCTCKMLYSVPIVP